MCERPTGGPISLGLRRASPWSPWRLPWVLRAQAPGKRVATCSSTNSLHAFAPFSLDNGDDDRTYVDDTHGTSAARARCRCLKTEGSIRAFVVIRDDDTQQQQQTEEEEEEERPVGKSITMRCESQFNYIWAQN